MSIILFFLGVSVTINLLIIAAAIVIYEIKKEKKKEIEKRDPYINFWRN